MADKMFQLYGSSLQTHRIITPKGKVLTVQEGKLLVDNEEDIKFLDSEIESGSFHYLTKKDKVTSDYADPMAAYKARIRAEMEEEFKKQKEAEEILAAASGTTLLGDITPVAPEATQGVKLNPASSATLRKLAQSSNSQ